ncbi:Threonine dehydrogenase [Desulfonatronum thiosulfatophilum]|uniref:Threonine dehydrogenase n=1 Tax=Desulfonatronum thiosulfatophilum TaxID=617002 RepID=A0A1G6DL00_9BACT|nr:zinc-dependent alcohol dehydrogenase [Desulfonatronum thiosulfatophilum]SDB45515.1 Threonine dehydrogenase [Desulfonatronum thiosulfatophilum]
MKALVWHGKRDIRVENVPDPKILEETDAVIRVTTTAICGSDLHLYEVLGAFMTPGDIMGHEPMGIVEEVGKGVSHIKPGDRVVIPFNISCGSCFMCSDGLQSQCETTQVRSHGTGGSIFGYSKLYGQVAGGQAEYLRVPQAHYGPIKVPEGPPDETFIYLADVLPTAWQAVEYANIPKNGTAVVFGLGPIGQMCARIARLRGARVIGVDLIPQRLKMARRHFVEVVNLNDHKDIAESLREMTSGRGPDSVIDAVGMEAHGAPVGKLAHQITSLLPSALSEAMMKKTGVDRLSALSASIDTVRRGGTVSVVGVYGGAADPLPMLKLFDKQIQLRMGQANVKRWIDDIMPYVTDGKDPLGVNHLATHTLPLDEGPRGYEMFQKKWDGVVKVLLKP